MQTKLIQWNFNLDLYGKDFNLERLAIQLSILHCNLPFEIHRQTGGMKLKCINSISRNNSIQLNVSYSKKYWSLQNLFS